MQLRSSTNSWVFKENIQIYITKRPAILQSKWRKSIFLSHLGRLLEGNHQKKSIRRRHWKKIFILFAEAYLRNHISCKQSPSAIACIKHGYKHKVYTRPLLSSRTWATDWRTKSCKTNKKNDRRRNVQSVLCLKIFSEIFLTQFVTSGGQWNHCFFIVVFFFS